MVLSCLPPSLPRLPLLLLLLSLALSSDPASHALGDPGAPWIPKTLECTPWSWDLCSEVGVGTFKVMVNKQGGGGMQAPGHYLNGIFSLDMKLPAGYSGGTNFAWYLMDTISASNKDPLHSEIDMEFYGNTTGDKIMLALNVFANGKQNLAQFDLPFDVTAAFHTYTIKWGPKQIVWSVDGKPFRVLDKKPGMAWPKHAMKPMATVWATPWTALKPDFKKGPVSALYSNYKAAGCKVKDKDVQKEPIQCEGPWNLPMTPEEKAVFAKFHAETLIVDYGWDKV